MAANTREIAKGELFILAAKGQLETARLGFTPYKFPKDIARHYDIVRERHCEVPDCKQPLQAGKQHGWTCSDHDPLTIKKRS